MDLKNSPEIRLYLERAENKLIIAKTNFEISTNTELKKIIKIPENQTFFNDVISQSYYAIFYNSEPRKKTRLL
jgi:hypothetical protein